MKTGFDAKRIFHNFTGLGNYSRTLVHHLVDLYPGESWHLFTPSVSDHPRAVPFLSDRRLSVHLPEKGKWLWRSWRMKDALQKNQIDIYHGLSHEIPFGMGKNPGFKTVVTIHDLIFKIFPEQYRLPDRLIYDQKFSYSCRHADRIIATSEQTKDDIIRFYQIPPEKISVIYQSCDPMFYTQRDSSETTRILGKYGFPAEYILYVGSVIPRKNLLTLVMALGRIKENHRIPLVVIGKGGKYKQQILRYIHQHGLEKWVILANDIFYPDLPVIYQAASVFVFPSIYEGFGIPVIEALAGRVPVITSDRASLPEAAGPDSICLDPMDVDLLAFHIRKVLEDRQLSNQMREKGVRYASRFHFSTVTPQVMELYRELYSGKTL
ncbi:MAG: glycosyltransferase family 1 protein [Bacteroidia bacterium]